MVLEHEVTSNYTGGSALSFEGMDQTRLLAVETLVYEGEDAVESVKEDGGVCLLPGKREVDDAQGCPLVSEFLRRTVDDVGDLVGD